MEIFPGNLEEVGCVSKAIKTFPGDLEGLRCVSEAIEPFPCNFDFPLDVSTSEDVGLVVHYIRLPVF